MQNAPPAPWRHTRFALDILLAVLLLFLVLSGLLFWYVRSSQPGLDGHQRLAGLAAPVTVIRDQRGIPHITAANLHDLLFAQGYTMAQDRLWQMDLLRRLGEGRLAEILGPQALDFDRKNRQLGLGRMADREAARLAPADRAMLDAFSAGVNSYLTSRGRRLPLEFWLLRYHPEPWRPRDSLAMAAYMFQVLGSGYQDKLSRETLSAKLSPALAAELYPTLSPWDVVPGAPQTAAPPRLPRFAALPMFAAPGLTPPPLQGGSNDWVLAGARSFNGKPILANDPHLPFQVPGLWWAAQLTAPGVNVAGVALAGVPGIIIGHNDFIAWGVTNTGADVQDLYRNDPVIDHWHDQILVKGAPPVALDTDVTRHGPVIAHDGGGALALAWSLYTPGALQSTHVFLALDQAQNYAQFEQALSAFPGPAQNFVYADAQGHIAYQCAGWVPIRRGFDGSVPVPADSAHDWRGWIPFAQLPHALDPPSGLLATANGRVAPNAYPYTITTNWDAPNRTRRIEQLLNALPRWNASAMGRVQQDVISEQDRDFAQAVVAAGAAAQARGAVLPASTRQALAMLLGFRGAMGHTSLAPALAFQTRREFLHRVLAAKLGETLARDYDHHESTVFEQWLLTTHPPQWLPPGATWDSLLLDSLANVVGEFTLQPSQLHWGRFETLRVLHPVFSHLPFVRNYADLGPVEINGSPLTVKQARNTWLGDPTDLGPSMRFVADLGDWDRSTLTLVAGESGQVFNPHYRDQFLPYLRGLALPLWFTPAAVAQHRAHQLLLTP